MFVLFFRLLKSLVLIWAPNSSITFFQAFFSANAAAQASRKSSPRVNNEAVQKAVSSSLAYIGVSYFLAILLVYMFYVIYLFCLMQIRLLD